MDRDETTVDDNLSGLVDAILEAGRQRKELLDQMRNALESGNLEKALICARRLCGLDHEKSSRIN
jgi:hypothetical protein